MQAAFDLARCALLRCDVGQRNACSSRASSSQTLLPRATALALKKVRAALPATSRRWLASHVTHSPTFSGQHFALAMSIAGHVRRASPAIRAPCPQAHPGGGHSELREGRLPTDGVSRECSLGRLPHLTKFSPVLFRRRDRTVTLFRCLDSGFAMIRSLSLLLLLVLPAIFAHAGGDRRASASLALSPEEQDWLNAHPVLHVATFESGWAPFEFMEGGQLKGLAPELLGRMAAELGVEMVPRQYKTWSEALAAACHGEVDVLMNTAMVSGRTSCLVFSPPYLDVAPAIIGLPKRHHLSHVDTLSTLRIAVERDFAMDVALEERFPQGRHLVVDNTRQALLAVKEGRADAYIGNPYVAMRLLKEPALAGPVILGPADFPTDTLHFATPDDRKHLASALRKALAAIAVQDIAGIRAKWLQGDMPWGYRSEGVPLTVKERNYVTSLPVLKVAFDRNWDPVSIRGQDGQLTGLSGDYLALVASRLGVRFDTGRATTRRGLSDLLATRAAEVAPVAKGTKLGRGWRTTAPFARLPNVIATRGDRSFIGIDDLNGRTVAVPDGYRVQVVKRLAPAAVVRPVQTLDQAFRGVLDGRYDAMIGDVFSIDKAIRSGEYPSVRINAPAGFDDEMVFAVDDRYDALVPLIDRVLSNLGEVDERAIRKAWTTVDYEYGVPWEKVVLAAAVGGMLLLVVGIAYYRTTCEIRAREASDRLLSDVTRSLPCLVFKARLDGEDGWSFLYVAGNATQLLGIDNDELIKDASGALRELHAEDHELLRQAIRQSARDMAPLEVEVRLDGAIEPRWLSINGIPRQIPNGLIHWTGYIADVTEKRLRLDALAKAKDKAEAATQAKSRFLSIMSHEIRTPMGGILGFVELLEMTPLTREQKRLLSLVQQSSRSLRTILDDILDYSKIEAGQLRLELQRLALRDVICNTVELSAKAAREKGLRVSCNIDTRLAGLVLGDETRIRQVLVNFLSNAIKFTSHGSVQVRLDVLEMAPPRQTWHLSVTDSGIGMNEDQLSRIFEPFAQAEDSTTRHYGGTGLGLPICQQLAALMGGRITLASEPGKGSRVGLELQTEVIRLDATDPRLIGRNFRIQSTDFAVSTQLAEILQSLGMSESRRGRPADLLFADARYGQCDNPSAIQLVDEPVERGREAGCIALAVNPLLHTAVQQACQQAVEALSATPVLSLSGPSRLSTSGYGRAKRILVAEDNPISQTLIAKQLSELGYVPVVVSDGQAALEQLNHGSFDLLITDIQMPGLDGYQLVAEIRRREASSPGRRLPVVAMTAGALTEDIERCLAAGMDDYVAKPVPMSVLSRLLQRSTATSTCH